MSAPAGLTAVGQLLLVNRGSEVPNRNLKTPPEICPHCGEDVPRNAKACPECGSDEQTGWSEEAAAADLGLPDDSFDYDRFVREEFGERQAVGHGGTWRWWLAAAVVGILILVGILVWR